MIIAVRQAGRRIDTDHRGPNAGTNNWDHPAFFDDTPGNPSMRLRQQRIGFEWNSEIQTCLSQLSMR